VGSANGIGGEGSLGRGGGGECEGVQDGEESNANLPRTRRRGRSGAGPVLSGPYPTCPVGAGRMQGFCLYRRAFFWFDHTRIQPYIDNDGPFFPVCRPATVREAPKSGLGGSALAPQTLCLSTAFHLPPGIELRVYLEVKRPTLTTTPGAQLPLKGLQDCTGHQKTSIFFFRPPQSCELLLGQSFSSLAKLLKI